MSSVLVVPAVLLIGAALAGLGALVAGAGGKLTRLARRLLVGGGALWFGAVAFEVTWSTDAASGAGRLHLWFSGITLAMALATVAGGHFERRSKATDGRFETIGCVLTGMLAVIAVFYAQVAVLPSGGSQIHQHIGPATAVGGDVTCAVSSTSPGPSTASETGANRRNPPTLCSATTSTGATHAVYSVPPRGIVASPGR